MINKCCSHCKKYFYGMNKEDKCKKCDEQFKSVLISVTKRFSEALKGLGDNK